MTQEISLVMLCWSGGVLGLRINKWIGSTLFEQVHACTASAYLDPSIGILCPKSTSFAHYFSKEEVPAPELKRVDPWVKI